MLAIQTLPIAPTNMTVSHVNALLTQVLFATIGLVLVNGLMSNSHAKWIIAALELCDEKMKQNHFALNLC